MYFLIYCLEHHANLYQNQFKINMTLQGHAIETQLSKNAYLYLWKQSFFKFILMIPKTQVKNQDLNKF